MDPEQASGEDIRGWQWCAHATGLILRGTTWRVALPIALVVGTTLVLVNQEAVMASGNADTATGLRLVANYAIPYVVSSVGFLSAGTRVAAASTLLPGGRAGRSPGERR